MNTILGPGNQELASQMTQQIVNPPGQAGIQDMQQQAALQASQMVGPAAYKSSTLQTTIGNIANGLLGSGMGFKESVIDQALGLASEYVGPDIANGIANALFNGGADPYANGMPSIQDLTGTVGGLFEGAF